MPTGTRFIAAAVLCGSMAGCEGPNCTKGYEQIDDACHRRNDAGALEAGEEVEPSYDDAKDCDGVSEETQTWYCDNDGDGFAANANAKLDACEKPATSASCNGWTTTAPSEPNAQDCDDKTAQRFPGAGFGFAADSNDDLNCDGQTETRLEFVAAPVSAPIYSSTTTFNICHVLADELLGSSDATQCDCWFSTAIGGGFAGFANNSPIFDGPGWPSAPWFMRTFPCSEQVGDVIFLSHAGMLDGECLEDGPSVAVRQLCR